MSILNILYIRQRIATFLFARDTLKIQATCKTFLNWRAPYFLDVYYHYSIDTILCLAHRCSTLRIGFLFITGSDLTAMDFLVRIANQISLQLDIVSFNDNYPFAPHVFKQFMSTCVNETTRIFTKFRDHDDILLPEFLSFPHLKTIVVDRQYFAITNGNRIKNEDADPRIRVCSVAINCFTTSSSIVPVLDFFLQRLVPSYRMDHNFPLVGFYEKSPFQLVTVTSKEIIDFCDLVVLKFAGTRCFVLIDLDITLSDVANKEKVIDALVNMMKSDIRWAHGSHRSSFVVHHPSMRREIMMTFGDDSFTGRT
jgi:hypothetical protein